MYALMQQNNPFKSNLETVDLDKFVGYSAKIELNLKNSRYQLTTAKNYTDLLELAKMRSEIFFAGRVEKQGLDIDGYDAFYDHIMIRESKTGILCGTYRMATKNQVPSFYSEQEFELSDFLNSPGEKLELGRACIVEEHRNGHVLDLLWKGIGAYVNETQAKYVFGCSSIMSTSPSIANSLTDYFVESGFCIDQFNILPKEKYSLRDQIIDKKSFSQETIKEHIPALLNSYLKAGAKISPIPALDEDFQSLDFMTILSIDQICSRYKRRYF